jgi:hypothetical protein
MEDCQVDDDEKEDGSEKKSRACPLYLHKVER